MKVQEMSKDQLEAYAKEHFNVDLDKREKIDSLREQVANLENGNVAKSSVDGGEDQNQVFEQIKHNDQSFNDIAVSSADQQGQTNTQNPLVPQVSYLKNPKTGVVFVSTKALEKRGDLIPCSAPK